ncbi:hypothetical protein U1Q18_041967, partial [Sarracenia purpurea var. burkii]
MAEDETRSQGTVRWFDDQKGYGFISSDGGGFRTLQEGLVQRTVLEGERETKRDSFRDWDWVLLSVAMELHRNLDRLRTFIFEPPMVG